MESQLVEICISLITGISIPPPTAPLWKAIDCYPSTLHSCAYTIYPILSRDSVVIDNRDVTTHRNLESTAWLDNH